MVTSSDRAMSTVITTTTNDVVPVDTYYCTRRLQVGDGSEMAFGDGRVKGGAGAGGGVICEHLRLETVGSHRSNKNPACTAECHSSHTQCLLQNYRESRICAMRRALWNERWILLNRIDILLQTM